MKPDLVIKLLLGLIFLSLVSFNLYSALKGSGNHANQIDQETTINTDTNINTNTNSLHQPEKEEISKSKASSLRWIPEIFTAKDNAVSEEKDMIISELREENDALKKAIEIMRMKQAKETPTTVTSATVHPAVNKSSSGYDTTPLVVSVAKTEKQSSFAEQTKKNSLPMKLDRKIEGSADSSGDGDEEGQKLWQQTNELQKRIKEALKWVASSKDNIGWKKIGNGEVHMLYKLDKAMTALLEEFRTPEMLRQRIYDGIICSDNQREFQESFLGKIQMDICSEIEWYKVAQLSHPHARTFIDVGANKGYLAALFISLWGGGKSGINPLSVYEHATATNIWEGSRNPTGFCKDGMNMGIALYCPTSRDNEGVCEDYSEDVVVYSIDGSGILTNTMNNLISSQVLPTSYKKLGKVLPPTLSMGAATTSSLSEELLPISTALGKNGVSINAVQTQALPQVTSISKSLSTSSQKPFTKASTADDDTLPVKFKPTKVDYLIKSRRKLLGSTRGRQSEVWRYYNYAVSDSVGTTQFTKQGKGSKVGPGYEGGKMGAKEVAGFEVEVVNMTTIERFVLENEIERLDVLKIDAEGYDNKVLQGAMKLIEANVSLFVFEGYTWFTTPLVEHFDHVGFSCYSSSRAGLFKWNKECMSTENIDNKKGKGNVFCASRTHAPMITLTFDMLSFPGMHVQSSESSPVADKDNYDKVINWKKFCSQPSFPECALV